jgi:hypothetical protein
VTNGINSLITQKNLCHPLGLEVGAALGTKHLPPWERTDGLLDARWRPTPPLICERCSMKLLYKGKEGNGMDVYDLKARYTPALLAIAPPVIAGTLAFPALDATLRGIVGVMVSIGTPFFAARIARDAGKQLERRLVGQWGGLPSATMLRHRDNRINVITKNKVHSHLQSSGLKIPTIEQESAEALGADAFYAAASDHLRVIARQRKTVSVHRENINYGFARNLLALRPFALALDSIALLLLVGMAAVTGTVTTESGMAAAVATLTFLCWLIFVTPNFVLRSGEAYAKELIETALTE